VAQEQEIEQRIRGLVDSAVLSNGCELWEMKLAGTRGHRSLKVYIDAPGGVDIDQCRRVSQTLLPALTEEGLDDLDLEVSSPGAERRLRDLDDYRRFLGERVNVRFRLNGSEAAVEGRLTAVEEAAITVTGAREEQTRVPLEALVEGRLAVAFGGGDKIGRRRI
jgi:ribosome maturation factor RimP